MSFYKPITTEHAQRIAEEYDKTIVIILAYDPLTGMLHTTTYGAGPREKAWAAQGGEIATVALGAKVDEGFCFEDYRLDQAIKLLKALKAALVIIQETGGPYPGSDVDELEETVRVAEGFLGG